MVSNEGKIDKHDYKTNVSEEKNLNIKDEERLLGKWVQPSHTSTEVTLLISTH